MREIALYKLLGILFFSTLEEIMRCGGIYAGWRTNENRVWIVLIAAYLVLTSISLFYLFRTYAISIGI